MVFEVPLQRDDYVRVCLEIYFIPSEGVNARRDALHLMMTPNQASRLTRYEELLEYPAV